MHALIIEDEPIIALLIEDRLTAAGFTSIAFAVTEADAVALARERCADLVTADVRLADGCGIAAVEAICAQRSVPILFITATAEDLAARVPGAVILQKPFVAASLDGALAAALNGSAPRSEA